MEAERNIPIFKTPCQTEREERDLAIYNEYQQMTSVEGQSKTLVTEYLMKKYGIHSQGTIYVIRQRLDKGHTGNAEGYVRRHNGGYAESGA